MLHLQRNRRFVTYHLTITPSPLYSSRKSIILIQRHYRFIQHLFSIERAELSIIIIVYTIVLHWEAAVLKLCEKSARFKHGERRGAEFLEAIFTTALDNEHFGTDRCRSGFHVSGFITCNYRRGKCSKSSL